ncbi:pyridoxal phosphate-dependent aminotransferase [Archaeoglobus veneficus]|uniref:Aminotransferase n=1 Tax=Archaeoglobus veneficus (strain DSM 11195 / SNP6) TaxID=693661 RepID=F2KP14_ARCVS|nr:pyridoxal phosphate-dependent aminotransferase [Archaeoglobus veneficus]AEA46322.1 Aspartate transaminase [Archaeoglobus veneficus SNP6]
MEARRLSQISTSMIRRMFEVVQEARKKGIDVVNLSIGEPDFDTHPEIVEKACEAMRKSFTHYTSNFGIDELRAAIAERYGVEPKNVMVTAGASEALMNAALAFIEEGSKVVIPSPNFLSYFTYAKVCGGKIVQLKTHPTFEIDVDALNELMDKDVSLVFINYPNNPTGVVADEKTLKAVVEIASDCNAIVVSDEIYDAIYYDKKPTSLAGMENVVVVNGFSKSLAMTGWRIGFVIASETLLDSMLKVHQVNGVCAPAFAQKAVADVLLSGKADEIANEMVGEFRKRRDYVYDELKKMGLEVVKPEGAFYLFPRVPINCIEFAEKLVEKGVAVTPGLPFGDWNENYVRISYATSMENLRIAMERMKEFVEGL